MSKYALRRGLTAVLLVMLAFVAAGAQEFRGSLTGTVTDPNGAALPGATVEVRNVETNVPNTVTTNEEGAFSFPLLNPGRYTLTVNATGFAAATRENIEIRVADRLTLDVPMSVTGVGETVTTVASAPVLETGSVTTGTTITTQQITELPLAEGTAYQLATLAPGVNYTGNPQFTGPTSNGNLAAFRSNGATGSNQITLDGSPNYAFEGGVGFSPPSDAVQEFKVQTNAFDAQQGYSAGATVNVAIKSGTNDPHGSFWYFNRDRSRTANNFFANRSGQERPERTYHRFGGVFNGPVYIPKVYNGRDRTFFLVSYEGLKDNIAEPQLFTVPTAKMRQGDFSELIVNRNNIADPANVIIYNPFSGRQSGNNVTRTAFNCPTSGALPTGSTCNVIPTNLLNPVALAALQYYPLPNVAGTSNGTQLNFFSNQNRVQNYRGWLTRFDHRISDTKSIFGKYYHSFNPEDRQNWAGVVNGFPVTQGFEDRSNDGASIDYTQTLGSSVVLDIRANLNRFRQVRRPAESFDPATLGFSPEAVAAMRGYQYFPLFAIRNLDATRNTRSTLGAQRSDWTAGRNRPFYMGSIQPTVTQIFGNHTARYGYDMRVVRENFATQGALGGRFTFEGTYTTPASNSSTALRNVFGRDIAAFILGVPTTTVVDEPRDYAVQSVYHGFFFQDDWRVTPKLTLNLGLRYELEGGITERFNRLARGFDPNSVSPLDAAARAAYTTAYNANPGNFLLAPDQFRVLGGYNFADANNRSAWDADTSNWEPRFGLAYQLDDRTVLRGGFGIFMAPLQIPANFADNSNAATLMPGFSSATTFLTSTNNGLTVNTLTNPFTGGVAALRPAPGSSLGLLTRVGEEVGASDFGVVPVDRKNPKFARMVIGFQRELPGGFVVEGNFVHSRGYDLQVDRNLNFVPREFMGDVTGANTIAEAQAIDAAANTRLSATIPNPFRNLSVLNGTGSPFFNNANITRAQSLLRFPQFTNVYVQEYNGSNRYNSLQFQVNKRLSTGLSLSGSYTWSRLREQVNYLNASDTELEDRISPADRTHRVTASWVYELPLGRGRAFGKDMNRILDAFIGGWQFNGTYEWQTGEPFLFTAGPMFYAGDPTQLESRVGQGDGQGGKYAIDRPAFDTGNFLRLSSFTMRTLPTTLPNLRNQAFLSTNMSITKNFRVGEGKRIQFRAEAINAFNHPYFNVVNLDPNNASFGLTTGQRNNPRDIQLGAKFTF